MTDRVVLAPTQEKNREMVAERHPDGKLNLYRGPIQETACNAWLDDLEARHLRDLLCDWFGLPEGDFFQTRRQGGELRFFDTLSKALADAEDPEVWKVSFTVKEERVRLVRDDRGLLVYQSIMDELARIVGAEKAASLAATLRISGRDPGKGKPPVACSVCGVSTPDDRPDESWDPLCGVCFEKE